MVLRQNMKSVARENWRNRRLRKFISHNGVGPIVDAEFKAARKYQARKERCESIICAKNAHTCF